MHWALLQIHASSALLRLGTSCPRTEMNNTKRNVNKDVQGDCVKVPLVVC